MRDNPIAREHARFQAKGNVLTSGDTGAYDMTDSNSWRTFFDHHADKYMDEPFVKGTQGEVDLLIEHLGLNTDQVILDMGCGTGRHALELGRRGYHLVEVDLSEGMLGQARKAAQAAGLPTVTFQQADTTR